MFDFDLEPGKDSRNQYEGMRWEQPLMTVITPFFNAGRYIRQTYHCVMAQTFPWFEWIIVDDGSTEEVQVKNLQELCSKDSRMILIRKENGGISSARNAGIRAARTEILVMLDADDLIAPTYLEVLYWMLDKNPDCDWAYTNTVGFQNQQYLWNETFDAKRLKTYNFLTYSAAIRKSALEEAGYYDESEKHYYEDWHLWLRLLSLKKRPVKSSMYGFWYRRTDSGILEKVNKDEKIHKKAMRMIEQAAQKADETVTAKEYPCTPKANDFLPLCRSSWERQLPGQTEKTQILLIIPWMRMGGAEVFELEILKKIHKQQFAVTVVTTVDAPQEWRQRFEEYTDDVFELSSFLDMRDYPEFFSYLIQSRGIQLTMVTNSYYGYYLMPWLRKEFPRMALIDYVHMEEWYWRRGGYARISSSMKEITEHTFVCNENTRQVLIEKFGRKPEEVSTLYIGVDKERFSVEGTEPGQCYREFAIPEEKRIVLFPCRMDAQKRPFLMLEIAGEMKRRALPVVFVAVGDGVLLDSLKERSLEMNLQDSVFFAGQKEDMRPYYRDAALTLNCSLREGLALTAYESCAMGVPIVSADVGGQRELVNDRNGRILPLLQRESEDFGNTVYSLEEIRQYADAIEEILSDPDHYVSMCQECRRKVETDFSTDRMISRLEGVFLYYIKNEEQICRRERKAGILQEVPSMTEELILLYHEIESRDAMYASGLSAENKSELSRIVNSKWGRRMIKIFFKLKLNKLWR